jgi:hypothetical protein
MYLTQPKKLKVSRRPAAGPIVRLEQPQEAEELGGGNTAAVHEMNTPATVQKVIEVVVTVKGCHISTITLKSRAVFRYLGSGAVSNGPA